MFPLNHDPHIPLPWDIYPIIICLDALDQVRLKAYPASYCSYRPALCRADMFPRLSDREVQIRYSFRQTHYEQVLPCSFINACYAILNPYLYTHRSPVYSNAGVFLGQMIDHVEPVSCLCSAWVSLVFPSHIRLHGRFPLTSANLEETSSLSLSHPSPLAFSLPV